MKIINNCMLDRRIININNTSIDTKIKYKKVLDKIYEVEEISFFYFTVIAKESDKTLDDVPVEEVFDITDFKDFKIQLRNWHGNVVNFKEYAQNRKVKS